MTLQEIMKNIFSDQKDNTYHASLKNVIWALDEFKDTSEDYQLLRITYANQVIDGLKLVKQLTTEF